MAQMGRHNQGEALGDVVDRFGFIVSRVPHNEFVTSEDKIYRLTRRCPVRSCCFTRMHFSAGDHIRAVLGLGMDSRGVRSRALPDVASSGGTLGLARNANLCTLDSLRI